MEIIIHKASRNEISCIAPLCADFRVALKSYKGINDVPDIAAAAEELTEYFNLGFPIFCACDNGEYLGYAVCRIDGNCCWAESLYVKPEYRRRGAASMLFHEAEKIAAGFGEETVYCYVHPNNNGIIAFLNARGYNVLNLIEVRKPYKAEKLTEKINVGSHIFDY